MGEDVASSRRNALQIFHVNINVSSLEQTRAFYESIGFEVINDFSQPSSGGRVLTFAEIGLAEMLNLPPGCEARAMLMALSDGPRVTRLDVIEWIRPKSAPKPPGDLAQIGFGRLCLKVRDAWAIHERLLADRRRIYTPPMLIDMGGTRQLCFCAEDPDGLVVEFMHFLRDRDSVPTGPATV